MIAALPVSWLPWGSVIRRLMSLLTGDAGVRRGWARHRCQIRLFARGSSEFELDLAALAAPGAEPQAAQQSSAGRFSHNVVAVSRANPFARAAHRACRQRRPDPHALQLVDDLDREVRGAGHPGMVGVALSARPLIARPSGRAPRRQTPGSPAPPHDGLPPPELRGADPQQLDQRERPREGIRDHHRVDQRHRGAQLTVNLGDQHRPRRHPRAVQVSQTPQPRRVLITRQTDAHVHDSRRF